MQKSRNLTKIFLLILLAAVVVVALFPVPVSCGAPGRTCMSAPDDQGYVSVYYEVEPLAVALVEGMLRMDLPLKYAHGFSHERVIRP